MGAYYGINIIIIVILVAIWVLPIILFFKVWGMCNDVRRIKEIMEDREFRDSVQS